MDAIELLTTQHAEVAALFAKLDTETNDFSCREMVGRLADRLTMHGALEEEIFYPAVAALPGGDAVAAHALTEHQRIEDLLERLRDPHGTTRDYRGPLGELRRTVEQHVAEEERELIPLARRLGTATLRDLALHMEARIHAGEEAALDDAATG